MRREIRALQQQLGITMVYVTHDQIEAMSMADQVILLRRRPHRAGRAAGASSTRSPATMFAARFIGTPPMNLAAARPPTPDGAGDRRQRRSGMCRRRRGGCKLGVRPEHIALVRARHRRARSKLSNTSAPTRMLALPRRQRSGSPVRVAGRVALPPGERDQLGWATARQHFFDARRGRSGRRSASEPVACTAR